MRPVEYVNDHGYFLNYYFKFIAVFGLSFGIVWIDSDKQSEWHLNKDT